MEGIRFRTTQISGIPGKVTVALDEETGSVHIEQRVILSKDRIREIDDLKHCEIIRESKNYVVFERAVHFHRNTFGSILGIISKLIEEYDLMNKFPGEIGYAKISK
jgi:hypothetical protein